LEKLVQKKSFCLFLAQIMTQEFAKTPIIGQPGKIRPNSFLRKNRKKLVFFFIFVLSSFLRDISGSV